MSDEWERYTELPHSDRFAHAKPKPAKPLTPDPAEVRALASCLEKQPSSLPGYWEQVEQAAQHLRAYAALLDARARDAESREQPQSDSERLSLNAYGRKCYDAGLHARDADALRLGKAIMADLQTRAKYGDRDAETLRKVQALMETWRLQALDEAQRYRDEDVTVRLNRCRVAVLAILQEGQ